MSEGFDLGGNGGQYFSFGAPGADPGAHISGYVLDMKEVQATNFTTKELEFWDDGNPKMQYKVTLQTELREDQTDDGKRDVYLDGRRSLSDNGTKSKLFAVLDAVRKVTGGTQLQRGGKLTMQWVSGKGVVGDPRHYEAWYEAPAVDLAPGPPQQTVQQTVAHQAATGQQPPQFAQQAAPPVAPPVQQQLVPTEHGPVNPATGEITGPPPAQAAPPAAAPVSQFVNAQGVPATREAVAGLKAAGIDPAAVYAGYDGSLG